MQIFCRILTIIAIDLFNRGGIVYKIEKMGFGFKLEFSGFIKADEMTKWCDESKAALSTQSGKFGVLIDMRELKPLLPDAQEEMKKGQQLFKTKGMERSAVILDSPVVTMQFKRIGKETGIYDWERYIDASSNSNWEKTAIDWLKMETTLIKNKMYKKPFLRRGFFYAFYWLRDN